MGDPVAAAAVQLRQRSRGALGPSPARPAGRSGRRGGDPMTIAEPAMLALPSAGGDKPRGILTLTVLLADVAGIMLLVGLLAAFIHVRALHGPFPPRGVKIDRYLGNLV